MRRQRHPDVRTPLLLLGLVLAGCAASPSPDAAGRNVDGAMEPWKGRRVAEAVGMWGMPDSIVREGMLGVLTWKADNAPGRKPLPPAPGATQWAVLCTRVLSVDASETIVSGRVYGSGCSVDPEDYMPR
jgi:hypothetical protein